MSNFSHNHQKYDTDVKSYKLRNLKREALIHGQSTQDVSSGHLRFSKPLTSTLPRSTLGLTSTENGDPGTSFPECSTLTLYGPSSSGANVASYPSGTFFVGTSDAFPFGVVCVILQGASDLPVVTLTGLFSPTVTAKRGIGVVY